MYYEQSIFGLLRAVYRGEKDALQSSLWRKRYLKRLKNSRATVFFVGNGYCCPIKWLLLGIVWFCFVGTSKIKQKGGWPSYQEISPIFLSNPKTLSDSNIKNTPLRYSCTERESTIWKRLVSSFYLPKSLSEPSTYSNLPFAITLYCIECEFLR